jgi:broad specificity phosphatase PhoE
VILWLEKTLESHSPPTRCTLISHAATAAVRRAVFPLDEALDEIVSAEIASLAWVAPRAQRIWSGPELRTQQTAEALKLHAVVANELRDCDYGRWNGMELSEVQLREPDAVMAWLTDTAAAPHGGESIAVLIERVGDWLEGQRNTGHTVAVTHSAVIRAAVIYALDAPLQSFWRLDVAPLSLTDLRFNGRAWTLRVMGCALPRSFGL